MRAIIAYLLGMAMLWYGGSASADRVRWNVAAGGNGHEYEVVAAPGGIAWEVADAQARAAGGHLATITSAAENEFVFRLVDSSDYWRTEPNSKTAWGPWIGGRQAADAANPSSGWAWVTGERFAYTNWHPREPNDFEGRTEDRLQFFAAAARTGERSPFWNDDSAQPSAIAYVVEFAPKRALQRTNAIPNPDNGHFYMRLEKPMGWHEAKRRCEQLGGHLATVTSPDENRFVFQNFAQDHVCWLGATDEAKEGEWRWVTGEPFDYQNWFSSEPNNEGGAENFLVLGNTSSITDGGKRYYYRFGMRWNDHDEPGTYHRRPIAFPVCEWEKTPPAMQTAAEDRRGIATHAQSAILPVTDANGSKLPLHTFCLDADGYLLAGVGGENLEVAPGEVRRFDPDGKHLATWSVPVKPEAIGIGPDGSIYVGGSGQLIKLDPAGEVVLERDAPHIRALQVNSDQIREQIIAQAERQKEMLAKQIETYEKRIAAIEEKDEEERTERDEKMLTSYRRTIERIRDAAARSPRLSDDQIERRVQATIDRKRKVSSISAAAGDVYVACPGAVGYGFDIWRLDENFENARQIVTGLRGCCGQMDVQAGPDGVFVAENSRKRVCRYDREGKLLTHWGKSARKGLVGFGSCCNPMNVAFGPERTVYTAEATTGRIKRYSPDGELLGLVGNVKIVPGCKNVAIAVAGDGDRVYMMDKTRTHIVLMTKAAEQVQFANVERSRAADRKRAEARILATATPPLRLLQAAFKGDAEQVKALLRANPELLNTRLPANPELTNSSQRHRTAGWTPLAVAAHHGQMEVVQTLLDFGAGVDFADNRGVTPLHAAASQGHGEIVALLLNNGADPNSKDRQRRTPLLLAVAAGHDEVAELLREHQQ